MDPSYLAENRDFVKSQIAACDKRIAKFNYMLEGFVLTEENKYLHKNYLEWRQSVEEERARYEKHLENIGLRCIDAPTFDSTLVPFEIADLRERVTKNITALSLHRVSEDDIAVFEDYRKCLSDVQKCLRDFERKH